MVTRIQKWGNSLAVRIPKAFAEEARLTENTPIEISLMDGKLLIEPAAQPVPSLQELLAQVTDDNIHPETDWGPPVGKETW